MAGFLIQKYVEQVFVREQERISSRCIRIEIEDVSTR